MNLTNKIKITTLDKRYAGHRQFRVVIEFHRMGGITGGFDRVKTFLKVRDWCNDMWGHSCERDLHIDLSEDLRKGEVEYQVNPHWSWYWNPSEPNFRIYFKGTEELNMFTMRWTGQ